MHLLWRLLTVISVDSCFGYSIVALNCEFGDVADLFAHLLACELFLIVQFVCEHSVRVVPGCGVLVMVHL